MANPLSIRQEAIKLFVTKKHEKKEKVTVIGIATSFEISTNDVRYDLKKIRESHFPFSDLFNMGEKMFKGGGFFK